MDCFAFTMLATYLFSPRIEIALYDGSPASIAKSSVVEYILERKGKTVGVNSGRIRKDKMAKSRAD